MSDFERFLIARNDALEQVACALLWHMSHPGTDASETDGDPALHDMALIGPLLDVAEEILEDAGHAVCHPYYGEDETPCYLTDTCHFALCPMRKSK